MKFSLVKSIDSSSDNHKNDVLNTKRALRDLGFYHGPLSALTHKTFFDSIEAFQTAVGLVPDRIIKPDGPTAKLISALIVGNRGSLSGKPDDDEPQAIVNVNVAAAVNLAAAVNVVLAAAAAVAIPVAVLGHGPSKRSRS
ncbi:MAG: hypothetical protein O3A84_05015 [Proteobacteria bacterium]|nr:hypothetical protein [Pseudomonadota bacterium]